jgi:hypothetical protein
MVKADDKVEYENEKEETIKEKFTNFDLLVERVNVLQEQLNNVCACLSENQLYRKLEVGTVDELEAFNRLKEEKEEE